MNADLLNEPHYSVAEAAELCGDVDPCTIRRWETRGIGPNKVRLRTVRVGGKLRILKRDLEQFLAAINPADQTPAEEGCGRG